MSWARFDDNMATHPKCAPLSDVAFRLMVHANLWARAQRTGGFVPRDMLPTILPGRSRATLAAAAQELVSAGCALHRTGLWELHENGWRIHDFDHYGQQNAAETRATGESGRSAIDPELSCKRAAAGRRGGLVSGAVRSRTVAPGAPTLSSSVAAELTVDPMPKQVARPMEATGPKQATSANEANQVSTIEPNPVPNPNPNPQVISLVSPEASEQNGKQGSRSNSDELLGGELNSRAHLDTPILERAKCHLRSSRTAVARYGSPLDWPELQAVWRVFESTWGKPDRPRDTNDPRVRLVLERFASGRTPEELSSAIRASKRYAPVAENPSYQRIKTILKDEEQVDNLLRLAEAPDRANGRIRAKQQGGWNAPATERASYG